MHPYRFTDAGGGCLAGNRSGNGAMTAVRVLTLGWEARRSGARSASVDPWADLSDQALVAVALQPQPEAYGELVRRYQQHMYNVVYRLVGEEQEALDLTQEAFVRAYRFLGSFDQSRPFRPWMARVATNVALSALECRRHPTVPFPPEQGTIARPCAAPADVSGEPEPSYLTAERAVALRAAILALPPRHRAVVELHYFQELSYDEIAHTLAMPVSDVRSYLFRARRQLRQRLAEGM